MTALPIVLRTLTLSLIVLHPLLVPGDPRRKVFGFFTR